MYGSDSCANNASSAACQAWSALAGPISQAYNATDEVSAFFATQSLDDLTSRFVRSIDTALSSTAALATTVNATDMPLPLLEDIYVCGFVPDRDCVLDDMAHCQQLSIDTCHKFDALPQELGSGLTVYAKVSVDSRRRFTASVHDRDDCTGRALGFDVGISQARLGVCTHLHLPIIGNLADFIFLTECALCVPDPELATTTTETTTSTIITTNPNGGLSSQGSNSTSTNTGAIVGAVVGSLVLCVLVIAAVILIRGKGLKKQVKLASLSFSSPDYTGDEDEESFASEGVVSFVDVHSDGAFPAGEDSEA